MSDQNEPKTAPTPIAAAGPHPTAALPAAGQVTAQTEAAPVDRPKPKSGPVRRVVAGILLVLSFILTPVAVTVGYVNVLIHDEGTYAEAVDGANLILQAFRRKRAEQAEKGQASRRTDAHDSEESE